jgi:hypothetical protein
MAPFDPYHIWLGIPETERPISKYRLLGITDFENNRGVISAAAERQTIYLRTLQAGEHEVLVAQLLNEVSQARVCLLDGKSKSRYDTQLRSDLEPTPEQDPLAFAADELAAVVSKPTTRSRSRSGGGKPFWKEPWAIPAGGGGIVVLLLLVWLFSTGEEPIESGQEHEKELQAEIASLKEKLVASGNSKAVGKSLSASLEQGLVNPDMFKIEVLSRPQWNTVAAHFPEKNNLAASGKAIASSEYPQWRSSHIFHKTRGGTYWCLGGKSGDGWLRVEWEEPVVGRYILLFGRNSNSVWLGTSLALNGTRLVRFNGMTDQSILVVDIGAIVRIESLMLLIGDWGPHAAGLDGIEVHRNRLVDKD